MHISGPVFRLQMTMSQGAMAEVSSVLLLASCGDPIVRARVGGTDFCVPQSNYVGTDYWWIPRDLPKGDSFRFAIPRFFEMHPDLTPRRDIKGRALGLSGLVTSRQPYFDWSHPRPGSYHFEQARMPAGAAENIIGDYVALYGSADRNDWKVWELPKSGMLTGETIAESGKLIASCKKYGARVKDAYISSDCSRVIVMDKIAVEYSFSYDDISRLAALDNAVTSHVLSWRCGQK